MLMLTEACVLQMVHERSHGQWQRRQWQRVCANPRPLFLFPLSPLALTLLLAVCISGQ